MEAKALVVPYLPADSRSAVGKPSASADRDPGSASGPKQRSSQPKRQPVQRNVPPLCFPLCCLSLLPLAAVREHAGGNIPLVAHYSLLGQWEGAFYSKGVGCPAFLPTGEEKKRVGGLQDCRCGVCGAAERRREERENPPRWGEQKFPAGEEITALVAALNICLEKCF